MRNVVQRKLNKSFFSCYRNSHSPGAVSNMTCNEAIKAAFCTVKGRNYHIADVAEHKTSLTYRIAKLVMEEEVAM